MTLTLTTSQEFTAETAASVRVTEIAIGPNSTEQDVFDGAALNLGVTVNSGPATEPSDVNEDAVGLILTASEGSGAAGDEVTVTVGVAEAEGAAVAGFVVSYPAEKLRLNEGFFTGYSDSLFQLADLNEAPGLATVGLVAADPIPAAMGEGSLIELTFEILGSASEGEVIDLTLSVLEFTDAEGNSLSVTIEHGSITVESPVTPGDGDGQEQPVSSDQIAHIDLADLPTADGDLADWEGLFDAPQLVQSDFSSIAGSISGPVPPSDQNIEVWLGWNQQTNLIYLAARVEDDLFRHRVICGPGQCLAQRRHRSGDRRRSQRGYIRPADSYCPAVRDEPGTGPEGGADDAGHDRSSTSGVRGRQA